MRSSSLIFMLKLYLYIIEFDVNFEDEFASTSDVDFGKNST